MGTAEEYFLFGQVSILERRTTYISINKHHWRGDQHVSEMNLENKLKIDFALHGMAGVYCEYDLMLVPGQWAIVTDWMRNEESCMWSLSPFSTVHPELDCTLRAAL